MYDFRLKKIKCELDLEPYPIPKNSNSMQELEGLSHATALDLNMSCQVDSTSRFPLWYETLPFLVWESKFSEPYEFGIVDEPVALWLGYELGSPLWDLIDYETWPPVGLQLSVYISPGSKVMYPDFVCFTLGATLVVTPLGYCPKHPPPASGACITSPFSICDYPLLQVGIGAVGPAASPKVITKYKIN